MINTSCIISTEEKYKLILEDFFTNHFEKDFLVSHGLDHHRRVWIYAKELLQYFENQFDQLFIQKLLIACYLHDIGMSVDTGIKHGQHSRELCILFLKEHHLEEADYKDVLSAIENHDNKDYDNPAGQDKLLTILSVADDLDAFGYIGIYRYLEIYLARGVMVENLECMVLENAGRRFRNFEKAFSGYPELIERHRKRYNCLVVFFEALEQELRN
jgi:HD superfamily phosphodiesterase